MTTDPSGFAYWKELLGAALAGVYGAVGWVWKKADGSASKEDLQRHLDHDTARFDRMLASFKAENEEGRETMKLLFANAESDRKQINDRFTRMLEKIHAVENEANKKHLDAMIEIGRAK